MEAANFHFSHLKRKQDYGHQAVGVLLSCNGITLNYTMIMYDKSVSKIDTVKQIAEETYRKKVCKNAVNYGKI